jgi:hypothetical protein
MNVSEAGAAGGERQPLLGGMTLTRGASKKRGLGPAKGAGGQSSWLLYGQEEGKTELEWRETQNFYFMVMASLAFIGMVFAILENEILWWVAICLAICPETSLCC